MKQKKEFSAGGVVYKKNNNHGWLFLIGKHSGYHKWVLPKGLVEEGETPSEAAIRETEEEMGVKTKLVLEEPLHKEHYVYIADFKKEKKKKEDIEEPKRNKGTRRVKNYQEKGGSKTKVSKTVVFYLLKHLKGDPQKEHGWEMEKAGWYSYEKAMDKLTFDGERKALKKGKEEIQEL